MQTTHGMESGTKPNGEAEGRGGSGEVLWVLQQGERSLLVSLAGEEHRGGFGAQSLSDIMPSYVKQTTKETNKPFNKRGGGDSA